MVVRKRPRISCNGISARGRKDSFCTNHYSANKYVIYTATNKGGGYWRNGSVNRAYAADNNVKAHLQLSVLYNLRKLMTIGSYERLFMWLFTP